MKLVSESLEGELVDVRSFMAGDIFFQLTLLRADGSLVAIIVDGTTGALMPANSEQAKSIRIAAKANNANSGANAHANPNSNAGGNGNSGNNGNAGGNGGGNGNGNGNGNK